MRKISIFDEDSFLHTTNLNSMMPIVKPCLSGIVLSALLFKHLVVAWSREVFRFLLLPGSVCSWHKLFLKRHATLLIYLWVILERCQQRFRFWCHCLFIPWLVRYSMTITLWSTGWGFLRYVLVSSLVCLSCRGAAISVFTRCWGHQVSCRSALCGFSLVLCRFALIDLG